MMGEPLTETELLRREVDDLKQRVQRLVRQMGIIEYAVAQAVTVIGGSNAEQFQRDFQQRMKEAGR